MEEINQHFYIFSLLSFVFNIKSAFSIIIDDLNRLDVSMMLCLGLFVIHRKYYGRCSHRLEYRRYLLSLCANIELALGWKLNKREHSQSRLRTDESSFNSHSLQYWGIFSLCLLLQFLISTGDQCSAWCHKTISINNIDTDYIYWYLLHTKHTDVHGREWSSDSIMSSV